MSEASMMIGGSVVYFPELDREEWFDMYPDVSFAVEAL